MTQSWSVRIYKEGDQLGILELMKSNGIERTNEHWFWEYKNNPFGHHIGVAEHNGQIVGHMALIPTYMKVGDKTIMGSQAVDLLVHPKFRRQGMFLALGTMLTNEARKKQIDITYGFPNAPAHSGHLKYGWVDVCRVPLLIKPINIGKVASILDKYKTVRFLNKHKISRNVIKLILHIILPTINFFSRILNRIGDNRDLKNVRISTIESFDDRIDDFWKKVSSDYNIIVARNKKYLNWRYFRKPNVKYTVLLAEKNSEILGYIVLRSISQENLRLGYIVDILASLDEKVVIQSLILKSIEHFRKENVDSIFCSMLNNNLAAGTYYNILRYNGFIPVSSNPLIARVNSPELSKKSVGDSTKWYITIGDSDDI
jgi:GNAT superfamily N-acetyltransferase